MAGKTLTLETIMLRMKTDKINSIQKLNLWGNDIENIDCLVNVPNLEVVSLTVNKIKSLKSFAKLSHIKELYLRNNRIASFSEVSFLKNCKQLKTLTLNENPISDSKEYRSKIIQILPQLIKLDDKVITPEERKQSEEIPTEEESDKNEEINDEDVKEKFENFKKQVSQVEDKKEKERERENQNLVNNIMNSNKNQKNISRGKNF